MSKPSCNPVDTILERMKETNPDGSPKYSPAEISKFIGIAIRDGMISKEEIKTGLGLKSEILTDDEFKELEVFQDRIVSSNQPLGILFSRDELIRLRYLASRARNSVKVPTNLLGDTALDTIIDALVTEQPTNTVALLDLLDKAIDEATYRGNDAKRQSLTSLRDKLIKANDVFARVGIDWKAIRNNNSKRQRLISSLTLFKGLRALGDAETIKLRNDMFAKRLLAIGQEKIKLETRTDLSVEERSKEKRKLQKEERQIIREMERTASNKHKKRIKKYDERIASLEREILKLEDKAPDQYLSKILAVLGGHDQDYYVQSLRDLQKRQLEAQENIKFVEEAFAKKFDGTDKDPIYKGYIVNWLGEDFFKDEKINLYFQEVETDSTGKPKKTSDGLPVIREIESISPEKLKAIFYKWVDWRESKAYGGSITNREAARIQQILASTGDTSLPNDLDIDAPVPVAENAEQRVNQKVGYQYNPTNASDVSKAITDLNVFMRRLRYLSGLQNVQGLIPRSWLVGALGKDAQSLMHLFDAALTDGYNLNNPLVPQTELSMEGKLLSIQNLLTKMGVLPEQLTRMPEFNDKNFLGDFSKVVTYDLEWNPEGQIVAASISTTLGGDTSTRTVEVIYNRTNPDQVWTKEDAKAFLNKLNDLQNSGYKVFGHNTHGIDSDLQKLITISEDTNLGFSVAARSYDTMLIAFRGAPTSTFTRNYGPSLENLASAYGVSFIKTTEGEEAHKLWKTNRLKFEAYITGDAVAVSDIVFGMLKKSGTKETVNVLNNRTKKLEDVTVMELTPMWYDTGRPMVGRHPKFEGVNHLFDITSFRNYRELNGGNPVDSVYYDISKLQSITISTIADLLIIVSPERADALVQQINGKEKNIAKAIERAIEISRENHAAYLPLLQELRSRNGNKFLMKPTSVGGYVEYSMSDSAMEYEDYVVAEVIDMIRHYNRNPQKTIAEFAAKIGFRERNNGEGIEIYIKELIAFSSNKYNSKEMRNNKEITIVDYGNGNFDYVSAEQLGRGFAQVMLGFIEDGLTLSQDVKAPLKHLDAMRAATNEEYDPIAQDENIQKREFLPITKRNVSYFAPISHYEHERAYSDFALRQRYVHILERDLTDADIANWYKFVSENKISEFRQNIANVHKLIIEEKNNKTKATDEEDKKLYQDIIDSLYSELSGLKQEYSSYLESLNRGRLEQGRMQLYSLRNPTNNRDLYTRIPTLAESIEMSAETALDLPALVAVWVHDSRSIDGSEEMFLDGPVYVENLIGSVGGPTGATTIASIFPVIAHYMNNPILTPSIVTKSLENGYELLKSGRAKYSKSTYFDDRFNGLHHLKILEITYFPEVAQEGKNLLEGLLDLANLKTKENLTDYYTKVANGFEDALEDYQRKLHLAGPESKSELERVTKILTILQNPDSKVRNFIKGAVIPVIYSGGQPAVIKGLTDKKSKADKNDPITDLTNEDIKLIADLLLRSAAGNTVRLIDTLLDLDPKLAPKISEVILQRSSDNVTVVQDRWKKILKENESMLESDIVRLPLILKAIDERLQYVAELLAPPNLSNVERAEWIKEKKQLLRIKWKDRIDKALKIVKDNGDSLEFNSEDERAFHVALAGGEAPFKAQMNLRFINNAQNVGLKLNDDNKTLLNASVRTGRLILPSDVYLSGHIVFSMVGLGTTTGRAQYIGNYLTNLHGSSLSKANRIAYNEDGTVNFDDTVSNSMWSISRNPLSGMDRAVAKKEIEKAAIKTLMLEIATDYPPDIIGYDTNNESREAFYREWSTRTNKESEYDFFTRNSDREKLKEQYLIETGQVLTDDQIDKDIASNSIPFDKRLGTRILAPNALIGSASNIMTNADAKGLAAFRPRLADISFQDRPVSGLFNIYKGASRETIGTSSIVQKLPKRKAKPITASEVLKMDQTRGSEYDPNTMGIYFPEANTSLIEEIAGVEDTSNQKALKLKFTLDAFAYQNGLKALVESKNYAQLYQIYRVRQAMVKFARMISQKNLDYNQIRYYQRAFIMEVFKITKGVRDAKNAKRNIIDFSKSIQIDPEKFRYEDGSNMNWMDSLLVLQKLGITELDSLKISVYPAEFMTTNTEVSSILANEPTRPKPISVQGHEIGDLIASMFAFDRVKEIATKYMENKKARGEITEVEYDPSGKFVLLSSISQEDAMNIVYKEVMRDEDLFIAVANNLGFYITLSVFNKEVYAKLSRLKPHTSSGVLLVERPGVGMPIINRTEQGEKDIGFLLTPEALRQLLQGARNAISLAQIETAVQVNKLLGGATYVDQLRREKYADFYESHREALAEETELLEILTEGNLEKAGTTRLRDELGLPMDLYDSEGYFKRPVKEIDGKTVFQIALGLDLYSALERSKEYPQLSSEIKRVGKDGYVFDDNKELQAFFKLVEDQGFNEEVQLGLFVIFLKNNIGRELQNWELKAILHDHVGDSFKTDSEVERIIGWADGLQTRFIDVINHKPFSFKNKFIGLAFRIMQKVNELPDITPDEGNARFTETYLIADKIKEYGIADEDQKEFTIAIMTARRILNSYKGDMELYKTVPDTTLAAIARDPDEFELAFPFEGPRINGEIQRLVNDGTITQEAGDFYRLLIGKVLKHNPNLAPFISIVPADLGDYRAAEAEKEGGKFTIRVNPKAMQNMTTSDQIRVFAHEMGHIARLAFIKDGSKEYNQIVSLLKSKRGKQAISTILLALNGGKKYDGFEREVAYYTDNPEEFAAQLGGWILINNTLNNQEIVNWVEKRSIPAKSALRFYYNAFYQVRHQLKGIAVGLSDVDQETFDVILEITDNMFGFTSSKEREIFVENRNKTLGMLESFNTVLSQEEINRATLLSKKEKNATISPAEQAELLSLRAKYNTPDGVFKPTQGLDLIDYLELREQRIAQQSPSSRFNENPVYHISEISQDQRKEKEIVQTIINGALLDAGKISKNTSTVGGAVRYLLENLFGVSEGGIANAIDLLYTLQTFRSNQAESTYNSRQKVVAALMHLISSTLSDVEGAYTTTDGARSLIENRNYTKQFVDRVTTEITKVRMISTSKEEAKFMLTEALLLAAGSTRSLPPTLRPEVENQIKNLAKAISKNNEQMLLIIHGKDALTERESFLTQFNPRNFVVLPNSSRRTNAKVANNKRKLLDSMVEIARSKIERSGIISSGFLYLSGLAPRLNQGIASTEVHEDEFIKAWNESSINVQELIIEIAVRTELENSTLSEASIRNRFGLIRTDPTLGSKNDKLALFKATQKFYAIVHQHKRLEDIERAINKLAYLKVSSPGITTRLLRNEINRMLDADDTIPESVINNVFGTQKEREASNLPVGVSGGGSQGATPFSDLANVAKRLLDTSGNKRTKLMHYVVAIEAINLGINANFIKRNSLVTGQDMLSHPVIREFLSIDTGRMMIDIERSKGFRAASSNAIERITGVQGYDIYQIMGMIERQIPNLFANERRGVWKRNNSTRTNEDVLKKQLQVVYEKLKAEQGMSTSDQLRDADSETRTLAKFGLGIATAILGGTLNAASFVAEVTLHNYIVANYGGNAIRFTATFFQSVFGYMWQSTKNMFKNVKEGRIGNAFLTANIKGTCVNMMRSMERAIYNPRDIAMDEFNDDLPEEKGRISKGVSGYLAFKRGVNNVTFNSALNAASTESQEMVLKHVRNGNLIKLRTMFSNTLTTKQAARLKELAAKETAGTITPSEQSELTTLRAKHVIRNRDDLRKVMKKLKISGIEPEIVMMIKDAGIFEGKTIELLNFFSGAWFKNNSGVPSELREGLIDINAVLSWTESSRRGLVPASVGGADANDSANVYKATASLYNIMQRLNGLTFNRHNAFLKDTRTNVHHIMKWFWRNFPNLLFINKMQLISRMGWKKFLGVIAMLVITDLIYNVLSLVAAGLMPPEMLNPFDPKHTNEERWKYLKLAMTRSSILGNSLSILNNFAFFLHDYFQSDSSQVKSQRQRLEEALPFTPRVIAGNQLLKIAEAMLVGIRGLTGTSPHLSPQQQWDQSNAVIDLGLRFVPFLDGLSARHFIKEKLIGERPEYQLRQQVPLQNQNKEQVKPKEIKKATDVKVGLSDVLKPLLPPDSLFA